MRRLPGLFAALAAVLLCSACGLFTDKNEVAEKVAIQLRQRMQ